MSVAQTGAGKQTGRFDDPGVLTDTMTGIGSTIGKPATDNRKILIREDFPALDIDQPALSQHQIRWLAARRDRNKLRQHLMPSCRDCRH